MMKRLLLTMMTALMLIAAMAGAAWTQVDENDDTIVYADVATIKRSENLATMWHLNDLKTARTTVITMSAGESYLSTKMQQEYDCQAAKVRVLSFAAYTGNMGSGNVVLSADDATYWAPVSPDGTAAMLFKMACGKRLALGGQHAG